MYEQRPKQKWEDTQKLIWKKECQTVDWFYCVRIGSNLRQLLWTLMSQSENLHNKTGNVRTMSHWNVVVQPYFQWKSNKYCTVLMFICSLRCPARNAHAAQLRQPRPGRLYSIFPHYLRNGIVFEQKSFQHEIVFWFSPQPWSGTFLIPRTTEREVIKKCIFVSV
jgi:hypothetical protein